MNKWYTILRTSNNGFREHMKAIKTLRNFYSYQQILKKQLCKYKKHYGIIHVTSEGKCLKTINNF